MFSKIHFQCGVVFQLGMFSLWIGVCGLLLVFWMGPLTVSMFLSWDQILGPNTVSNLDNNTIKLFIYSMQSNYTANDFKVSLSAR